MNQEGIDAEWDAYRRTWEGFDTRAFRSIVLSPTSRAVVYENHRVDGGTKIILHARVGRLQNGAERAVSAKHPDWWQHWAPNEVGCHFTVDATAPDDDAAIRDRIIAEGIEDGWWL